MATELRSLAAAYAAHAYFGALPLDPAVQHQRARMAVGGLCFALYYRGSAYVFRGMAELDTSPLVSQPTSALVTTGPYALSRNPAALLVWLFHLACALALNSAWALLVALPVTYTYLAVVTVPDEEKELGEKFGAAYRRYRSRTPRYCIPHSWLVARCCRRATRTVRCSPRDDDSCDRPYRHPFSPPVNALSSWIPLCTRSSLPIHLCRVCLTSITRPVISLAQG
jgi:protein-S-isoprenylcysteine O-methyltransferase Ste14